MRRFLLAACLVLLLPARVHALTPTWSQKEDRAAVLADKNAHLQHHAISDRVQTTGEDLSSAIPIPSLPFSVSGNTCSYADDYDQSCPYYAPGSPDVVYAYSPSAGGSIDIDLCASQYDTKVYVYDNAATTPIACNDDAGCGITGYQSALMQVPVVAGHTYYIVVDGYGGDCGDYQLVVTAHQACFACQPYDQPEGEPSCADGYIDVFNGGCNSTPPRYTPVTCGTICGSAGTYTMPDGNYRDTDWYEITVGPGTYTYSGTGDGFSMRLFVLSAACAPTVLGTLATTPCVPGSLSFTGPGTFHLFAASNAFSGVPCGAKYRLDISGPGILACQATPASSSTWGALRLLYR